MSDLRTGHVGTAAQGKLGWLSPRNLDGQKRTRSMAGLKRTFALMLSTLREIFDESAYARFLAQHGMISCRRAYAAFLGEQESVKARRPKCC